MERLTICAMCTVCLLVDISGGGYRNHQPEDVREENLMAMCAPCHLRYDAKHHAETRRKKKLDCLEVMP